MEKNAGKARANEVEEKERKHPIRMLSE
jgi:hypothetical protein